MSIKRPTPYGVAYSCCQMFYLSGCRRERTFVCCLPQAKVGVPCRLPILAIYRLLLGAVRVFQCLLFAAAAVLA